MTPTPSLVIPAGWSFERCPDAGVDLFLCDQLPASNFRPRATLDNTPSALALPELLQTQTSQMCAALHQVDVEDADLVDLGALDAAYLRVLHRLDARDVITEVWTWLLDGTAWTLTATVDHRDYADYCDVFDLLAGSFQPGQPGAVA